MPFDPGLPMTDPVDAPRPAEGRDAWIALARRLGLGAAPGSDTFDAALLLVASVSIGPNVERLSRRTGVPRPFASKCARRLVDSGVWSDGRTVGEWVEDPTLPFAGESFLQDVAVAEGRLLRRVGSGGRFEWAPVGRWTKSFDGTEDEDASTATWVEAAPQPGDVVALKEEREDGAPAGGASSPAGAQTVELADRPAKRPEPAPAARPQVPPPAAEEPQVEEPADSAEATPSLEEVFSGAVWLR